MRNNKVFAFLLVLAIALKAGAQQMKIAEAVRFDGVVTVSDLKPAQQAVHPVAARAMARGENTRNIQKRTVSVRKERPCPDPCTEEPHKAEAGRHPRSYRRRLPAQSRFGLHRPRKRSGSAG